MAEGLEFDMHAEGIAYSIGLLANYDRSLTKELRKDIKVGLRPLVNKITDEINSEVTSALMSRDYEMFHSGITSWEGVRGYATIRTTKKQNAAQLIFTGRNKSLGFNYAELAGIERRKPRPRSRGWYRTGFRSYEYNGQGLTFNRRLTRDFGKPGRFAWIRVIKNRKEIEKQFLKVIKDFNRGFTRKLG